jgi:N-acetylglutamate synthase-like GNAT family acetyltransferase
MTNLAAQRKFCDTGRAETMGGQQPFEKEGCMLRVRLAEKSDKAGIIEQARAFFAASPMGQRVDFDEAGFGDFLDRAEASDAAQVWVVDKAGEIVGIAGAMAFPLYFAPSVTIAQELFWWIDPVERGTSAGAQMMFEIEGWAEKIGASQLFMIALEDERAATMARVYSRRGFSPIERTFTKEIRHGH